MLFYFKGNTLNSTSIVGTVSCDEMRPFWIQWTSDSVSVRTLNSHLGKITRSTINENDLSVTANFITLLFKRC